VAACATRPAAALRWCVLLCSPLRRPAIPTLFPYTTLFRSRAHRGHPRRRGAAVDPHRAGRRVVRLPRQVHRRRHPVPVPGPRWRRGGRDPRPRTARLPRRRVRRLGPRGRDARPRARPAADRGEHRAGHDRRLAGAQGRRAPGLRLRRAVLARAGADPVSALARILAWTLAVALVALPLVAVVQGWIGAERWPLRTLRINDDLQQVDPAAVREAVLPYAQAGFFAVPLDEVREAVVRLPWVDEVEVSKRWPD